MGLTSTTTVYLLLGIPGSGRRAIVHDLVENGLPPETSVGILLPASEAPTREERDLETLPGVTLAKCDQPPDDRNLPFPTCSFWFVIVPGEQNPVDQMERWKDWLFRNRSSFELGRILTLIHCRFLQNNPGARPWFDACIHFSDCILLNHRQETTNKWVGDFQKEQKKLHVPYLIELVKKGAVANPAKILEPQPRRLSQAFDFWAFESDAHNGWNIEIEGDPPHPDEEEDPVPEDPYFARMPGGRRLKKIPDIRKFL